MATRLNMAIVFLVMAALAAPLLQMSAAQTAHVVGDALGWTVPPGGSIAYSTWAAKENFTAGDVLVFNFTTGSHDVTKVSKAAFDSCNSSSPISKVTTGPANITLDVAGEHHFICTVGSHCNLGQKLAINVTAASSSPAPQPATPPQSSAPAPVPSATATPPPQSSAPAPVPSTTATPPSTSATPPSTTATPPSTTATPPSTSTSPPSPITPSPAGTDTPPEPPANAAPSFAAVGFPAVVLSIAVALLY